MKELWELYAAFFRIGLFTFGGGYAMLPMLQRETVEKYRWITEEEILDCYAIGQCTPGVIAVNTATFVGARRRGFWGAVAATCGVITPSIIIITVIAAALRSLMQLDAVARAFAGIRVAVAALVTAAAAGLIKKGVHDMLGRALFAVVFALAFFVGVSPVWIVPAVVVLGVLMALKGGRAS